MNIIEEKNLTHLHFLFTPEIIANDKMARESKDKTYKFKFNVI